MTGRHVGDPGTAVVLVHGYLSHGVGLYLMKRRLEREYGLQGLLFNYPSVRGTLDDNAAALAAFIRQQQLDTVHLIGHSLGGVLALRTLANHIDLAAGRVVCIGSPLSGSRAGRFLNAFDWAEDIIGNTLPQGVIHQSANDWAMQVASRREIGAIAGDVPLGLGRLLASFEDDNDGTVAVSETRIEGLADHLVMPVSHKGMLISADVADQAAAFLKRGEFLR